jgi:hypothetical protein
MQALAAFTAEAERGQDPDFKAFASRHRPHIEEHLNTIKSICQRLEKDQGDRQEPSDKGKASGKERSSDESK